MRVRGGRHKSRSSSFLSKPYLSIFAKD